MSKFLPLFTAVLLLLTGCAPPGAGLATASPRPLCVGTENFYADVIRQIGGDRVHVVAILNDPTLDPHEYEPTPANAVDVSRARLVVMNGLGYDAWMTHLLSGSPSSGRTVLNAGTLAGKHDGDNPHIWYDIRVMDRVAAAVTHALSAIAPADGRYFSLRLERFSRSLRPIHAAITEVRARYHGMRVAETEPVFGYMIDALGLTVPNLAFQQAIAAGSDPAPRTVIDFQNALKGHTVQALVYNNQATEPITETMASIARADHIPVIGVSETEPAGTRYQDWMLHTVQETASALASSRRAA